MRVKLPPGPPKGGNRISRNLNYQMLWALRNEVQKNQNEKEQKSHNESFFFQFVYLSYESRMKGPHEIFRSLGRNASVK